MKLERMESFFSKGRVSHKRLPIIIFHWGDGNEAVCEFTAALNGPNVRRRRGPHQRQHAFIKVNMHICKLAVLRSDAVYPGAIALFSQ